MVDFSYNLEIKVLSKWFKGIKFWMKLIKINGVFYWIFRIENVIYIKDDFDEIVLMISNCYM